MAWDSVMDSESCITPTEWNAMVAFIKGIGAVSCPTNAGTIFTIYSNCIGLTGQKFKFDYLGDDSKMYGGSTTGDDLFIFANSTDIYPFIQLEGDGEIYLDVSADEEIMFRTAGAQFFMFDHTGTNSQLYGSAIGGRDLTIYPNSSDALPKIELNGAGSIALYVDNDTEITFIEAGAEFFRFDRSGTQSILSGGAAGNNDLLIYSNLNDDCSALKLFGDSGASLLIKAGSIFDVSTCSNEKLFEVDSSAVGKHVDFHCLDAHNFVLELRTSDPSGPTCLGQIWFRTDLI